MALETQSEYGGGFRILKWGVLVTVIHVKHMQIFVSHTHFGLLEASLNDQQVSGLILGSTQLSLMHLKHCVELQAQEQTMIKKKALDTGFKQTIIQLKGISMETSEPLWIYHWNNLV